jgi:hypothetical protein
MGRPLLTSSVAKRRRKSWGANFTSANRGSVSISPSAARRIIRHIVVVDIARNPPACTFWNR